MRNGPSLLALALACVCLPACKPSGKPQIAHECVMNGMGQGSCTFTNTGKGVGAECGKVKVVNVKSNASKESPLFCSGQLPPLTTTRLEFSIVGLSDFCEAAGPGTTWSDVCSFQFETKTDLVL